MKNKSGKIKAQELMIGDTPHPGEVTPQQRDQKPQQDDVARVVEILDVVVKGQITILTKWMKEKEEA